MQLRCANLRYPDVHHHRIMWSIFPFQFHIHQMASFTQGGVSARLLRLKSEFLSQFVFPRWIRFGLGNKIGVLTSVTHWLPRWFQPIWLDGWPCPLLWVVDSSQKGTKVRPWLLPSPLLNPEQVWLSHVPGLALGQALQCINSLSPLVSDPEVLQGWELVTHRELRLLWPLQGCCSAQRFILGQFPPLENAGFVILVSWMLLDLMSCLNKS